MAAYYNENDPGAAAWLQELIKAGLIAPGDVDERSIEEVQSADVEGYTQAHFFAGIGGWSYALRLAGWPDDRPVWTGSCPCQPFSNAGKRRGIADERHLWPEWFRLIRECRPVTVFGEQVEAAIRVGWLDGVFADLEGEGYACGAAVLGAHSVGAPHIRQRLWWVADARRRRNELKYRPGEASVADGAIEGKAQQRQRCRADAWCSGGAGGLANAERDGRRLDLTKRGPQERTADRRPGPEHTHTHTSNGLGDSIESRLEGHTWHEHDGHQSRRDGTHGDGSVAAASVAGPWSRYDLIQCRDGKARRIEPGLAPLAHGASGRVGLLRGYGNAINPWVAKEFIEAYCEIVNQ